MARRPKKTKAPADAGMVAGSGIVSVAVSSAVQPAAMPMMSTEWVDVGRINPYQNNPRKNDRAVSAVAESISKFGFTQPIVVDKDFVIIIGHTRLKAALSLGYKTVPVYVATSLTEEQVRACRIADNKVGELAEWDEALLAQELVQATSFDWTRLGFRAGEFASLIKANAAAVSEDDAPTAAELEEDAVSNRGDVWRLGDHLLMHGDSLTDDVLTVMGSDRAALVATDPPYVVKYTGERPAGTGKDWSSKYNEVDYEPNAFFSEVCRRIVSVVRQGAAVYCWHASKRYPELVRAWEAAGLLVHQIVIWVKPTATFGMNLYQWRHEPCMVGWVQGSRPPNYEYGRGTTAWDDVAGTVKPYESLSREQLLEVVTAQSTVWSVEYESGRRMVGNEHPTQKPIELFARPIRKHTVKGDIVFEPFSGSGSCLIACHQSGRRCRAIEKAGPFVDVGVRRWQNLTGLQAVLAQSADSKLVGKTWTEVADARGKAVVNGA